MGLARAAQTNNLCITTKTPTWIFFFFFFFERKKAWNRPIEDKMAFCFSGFDVKNHENLFILPLEYYIFPMMSQKPKRLI